MLEIQFSLIRKIKVGRPEHSLTPHSLLPITSHFCLAPTPLKVNVIYVSPLTPWFNSYNYNSYYYSTKLGLRFCPSSNPVHRVSGVWGSVEPHQWSWLEIRLVELLSVSRFTKTIHNHIYIWLLGTSLHTAPQPSMKIKPLPLFHTFRGCNNVILTVIITPST